MFEDSITVYRLIDKNYVRNVINNIYWNECKQANVNKSGLVNSDSVKIIIPTDNEIEFTASRDLVCKGILDVEIDNTSLASQSISKKQIEESHKLYTINVIDNCLHGSLKHIELSCK